MALIAQQIGRQAEITAMLDVFKLTAWSFVLMLPLVLLLRRRRGAGARTPPAVAVE